MANVYQQAAKQRKLAYLGAILVLLGLSLLVRGTFFRIDKKSRQEVEQSQALALTLDGRAKLHELTELQQGDKELGGAAVQLLLTGSRGLAVSALWNSAIEKQKKQEWNELDIAVDSITKLQPHFTAPWLFQSWNLAYNVSVEMDRLNDMYFYIARGIGVLAEGESVNRNNPDLRYNVAFYYQNKFGVSDRVTTLRCLYQLSCLPEEDRDPEVLSNSDGTVNQAAFEEFCRTNPQLVRRMKETRIPVDGSEERARPLSTSPEAVVTFLKNNRKLPSRYKPGSRELNDRLKQFPVLPDFGDQPAAGEQDYRAALADHESDAFLASRGWYTLANRALPPPNPKPNNEGTLNPDPLKYRIPKRPATIIFRQGPMRAQTYLAERLTKEGWFDQEGWKIDESVDVDRMWLSRTGSDAKRVSLQLKSPASAQEAWQEAHRRWQEHGAANGLRLDPARIQKYYADALEFCRLVPGLQVGSPTPPLTPDQEQDSRVRELHDAHVVMHAWSSNRYMTNYESFELEADAMRTDDAMLAKKRFYEADKAVREAANYSRAVEQYDEGFAAWKRVLAQKQDCRRRRADSAHTNEACRDFRDLERPLEDVYELNLRYTKLAQDVDADRYRDAMVQLQDLVRYAGAGTAGNMLHGLGNLAVWYPLVPQLKAVTGLPVPGPLDGLDQDGQPWVPDGIKTRVREKLGLVKRSVPAMPPTMPGAPGAPPAPHDRPSE
jgi:hypothetical protein